MKPETESSKITPEQLPAKDITQGAENAPGLDKEEALINTGPERVEQIAEANAIIADIGSASSTSTPVQVSDDNDDDKNNVVTNTTIVQGNPTIAKDEDLIEKEWVDKAKRIVAETQNNPYKREDEVGGLRVDYLKKRFGRDLGAAK